MNFVNIFTTQAKNRTGGSRKNQGFDETNPF